MSVASSTQDIPAETAPLTSDEKTIFDRIFTRTYVFENLQREFNQILLRHKDEIQAGAEVAKGQFGRPFGGQDPGPQAFGMFLIRAPFFGLRSWTLDNTNYTGGGANVLIDGNQATAGVNTWISKALLTGAAGDASSPVVIGQYAVHVVVAIGDFSAAPVIESFQETYNGNPQPVFVVEHQFRNTNLKYAEFDAARLYKFNDTLLYQFNADANATSAPFEEPYLFGVSFLPFTQSKYLNPNLFNGGTSATSVIHY